MPARVLQVQPVDLPEDVRARPRVPQALDGQLVPGGQHGARQRAGRRRRLLALRHPSSSTRSLEQWFFRITAYADELLAGLDTLTEWPEKVVVMQRNWIGRSEGARLKFPVVGRAGSRHRGLHDAHRHDLRRDLRPARARASAGRHVRGRERGSGGVPGARSQAFRAPGQGRAPAAARKASTPDSSRSTRSPASRCRSGSANFVLAEYGTGAIMAVPAHDERDFEFARKYRLPIRIVVRVDGDAGDRASS